MLPDLEPPVRLSRPTRRFRLRKDYGALIEKYALCGAIMGILTMFVLIMTSSKYSIIAQLGFFYSLALGAVIGCMVCTLLGCVASGLKAD